MESNHSEFKQRQNSEWNSYMNSASKVRTDRILNLQDHYDLYDEWIKTCKDGSEEALNAYVNGKKYAQDYYDIANLMLEAWHFGKTEPNKYIRLAIEEYNWTLTKFLLNAGANPNYITKNGLDRFASPVQRLLDNSVYLYKTERALRYTGSDRDAILQQMIKQGANPNAKLCYSNVVFKKGAETSVIELILKYDVNNKNLNFLLSNNYLDQSGKEKAMGYLMSIYWSKDKEYTAAYEEACRISNITPSNKTQVDRRLEQMTALVKSGALMNSTTQYGESGTWYSFSEGNSTYDEMTGRFSMANYTPTKWPWWVHTFDSSMGSLDNWIALQNAVLDRADQVSREYVTQLAAICIVSEDVNKLTGLITRIIKAGIDPKSKELVWDKKYYSMFSLAKDNNPSLVDYLKSFK